MESTTTTDNAFPTVCITLCIIRKDDKFLCTKERDGWYLPAGRVDAGETFTTGALRETLEEGGIRAKLEGLLRLEHSPGLKNCRIRALFVGSPIDDTLPRGEDKADHEIIEAKWLTLPEIQAIHKLKLRSPELVTLMTWVAKGAQTYPLDILRGVDSANINHQVVHTRLVYSCFVIIRKDDLYLAMTDKDGKWRIPNTVMQKPTQFKNAGSSMFFQDTKVFINLTGIVSVDHKAGDEFTTGSMTVTYIGEIEEKDVQVINSYTKVQYLPLDQIQLNPYEEEIINTLSKRSIMPVDSIVLEQAPYK